MVTGTQLYYQTFLGIKDQEEKQNSEHATWRTRTLTSILYGIASIAVITSFLSLGTKNTM
jgi:hypothetical protein